MSCSEQDGSFFTAFSYLAGPSTQHFSCWFSDRLSPEDYTKEGRKNKKKREAEEKARRKAAKTKAPESVAGYLPFFKGLVSVPLRSTPSPGDRVYWELTALHSGCLPFASHTPVPMGRGSAGNQPPCREGLPSAVYVPRSRRTGYCEMTALQSGRLPFVSHTPVPMGRGRGEPTALQGGPALCSSSTPIPACRVLGADCPAEWASAFRIPYSGPDGPEVWGTRCLL